MQEVFGKNRERRPRRAGGRPASPILTLSQYQCTRRRRTFIRRLLQQIRKNGGTSGPPRRWANPRTNPRRFRDVAEILLPPCSDGAPSPAGSEEDLRYIAKAPW